MVADLLFDMESERVERTISTREEKLGPAVCAFSNDFSNSKQPGYILLGVNDDGKIAGIKWSDEELQKIGNVKTNGNILPQPSIVVSQPFIFPEGEIVVIEVKPSSYPPVRYDGRCWIRVGPRKAKATIEEEKILTERRAANAKTFDIAPAIHTTVAELNLDYFKHNYLPLAIDEETLKENGRTAEEQLASLRFYDIKEKCPSNAGIIMFGLRPEYHLPGDYLQYVKFAGDNMSTQVEFEKKFSFPLATGLGLIEDFIKINIIKERPVRIIDSFREHVARNYPYPALRELIMNAVMHRNYESNAPIYIYEFINRIEIVNPGGLYGDVNANNFPYASDYRNIVVAEAMKTLKYVNRFNYGIQRAKDELAANGNPPPLFDLSLVTKFKVSVWISDKW